MRPKKRVLVLGSDGNAVVDWAFRVDTWGMRVISRSDVTTETPADAVLLVTEDPHLATNTVLGYYPVPVVWVKRLRETNPFTAGAAAVAVDALELRAALKVVLKKKPGTKPGTVRQERAA